jgi:hypothetical protein
VEKGDAKVTPEAPTARDPDGARAAAANLFIHGFPPVLMDLVRRAHPVGFHQFQVIPYDAANLAPGLEEDDPRVVICSAFLDVGYEPIVLRLPHTYGRFFSLTLLDSVGQSFESLGSRTGDDVGVDLALVGPSWRGELPQGLRARRAPGGLIWAVSRIHAHSQLDRRDAVRVAESLGVAALRPERRRRGTTTALLEPPSSPCVRQLAQLSPAAFFHRLETVLKLAPTSFRAVVGPIIADFLRELDAPPDPTQWPQDLADDIAVGFADAMEAIRAAAAVPAALESEDLGWRILSNALHDRSSSPLAAAARTFTGLGAVVREDVLSLTCSTDETGAPLSGPQGYRIRFPRDGLPPVNAFWRLTVHAEGGHPPVEVGSYSDLTPNPDGSCDIHIQHWPPPVDQLVNWLSTPDGPITLVMRLYSPRPAALSGPWRMPAVCRLDSGSRGQEAPAPNVSSPSPRRLRPSSVDWKKTPVKRNFQGEAGHK